MGKKKFSRRTFVKNTVLATSGLSLAGMPLAYANSGENGPLINSVPIRWLDANAPEGFTGTTWGIPWKKGAIKDAEKLTLQTKEGKDVPVQSWPLAWWPDGSLKWTAHAMAPGYELAETYQIKTGHPAQPGLSILVKEDTGRITIDTGKIQCILAKEGNILVPAISRDGRTTAQNGRLILLNQNAASAEPGKTLQVEAFSGKIEKVTVEQAGPLRAVVKMEGSHEHAGRLWLPFVVRLYFYAGSETIRVMHTIIYDGDENKDFITGLGLRFDVPLDAAPYNRHVRFCGEDQGVFAEAVQTLTGLRRDPGETIRKTQVAGGMVADISTWPANVARNMKYVPAFGDYRLTQCTPDSFGIKKRTQAGHGWIQATYGKRSAGTGYLGIANGGLAFGIKNFWQSHPAQLDVNNAHTSLGEVTLWLWAPEAPAMDLRFYHDGMGQDTYPKQLDALDITYEDYEPGFGRPIGVARTSEMQLSILNSTPSNEKLASLASQIQAPPQLMCTPQYLKDAAAFGGYWDLPAVNNAATAPLEKQLDFYFDYYKKQIDSHRWYGYWNFGDVMHTYDSDRHVWRYDVGGYAWDNSELSTDIWLWLYFLRTGRADVFRMAEAMTRHTGEVDVHHIGPFSPLGSRHNVHHWGCSAKQLRISTAANRRYFYYLTADERVGDLMEEQVNAHVALQKIPAGRKLPGGSVQVATNNPGLVNLGFGTDWGAMAAAWLTQWERTQDKKLLEKLKNSMETIAQQPYGFFTGGGTMNLANGKFDIDKTNRVSVSHLSAAFGLPETCAELLQTIEASGFKKAWLQYCTLYNAPENEQKAALGQGLRRAVLRQSHSRLTAYAAWLTKDEALAKRAWEEFNEERMRAANTRVLKGPQVISPVEEADHISTNGVAQWSLAAIQCMACVPDEIYLIKSEG